MAATSKIIDVLGGPEVVGASVSTEEGLAERLRHGLASESLDALMDCLQISAKTLAGLLRMAPRTLTRRRAEAHLRPDESNAVYEMARVVAHALDVLGDTAAVRSWIREPNLALGESTPLREMDNAIGLGKVNRLLGRIEHGIFA